MNARDRGPRLRAGVMAAGQGERLRAAAGTLKPLVPIAGRPLVERVLASLSEADPSDVVIIVNEESRRVVDHVTGRDWPFALHWIVETTPSSMHSFLRVAEELAALSHGGERFLLSTVDTIAAPGAYADFVSAGRGLDADVVLAVTPPGAARVHDKPLLVRMHPGSSVIDAVGEGARLKAGGRDVWMTAGYYFVQPTVLREAQAARRDGLSALRLFLGRLVAAGYRVAGVPVAAGVDVDNLRDVGEAEAFVRRVEA